MPTHHRVARGAVRLLAPVALLAGTGCGGGGADAPTTPPAAQITSLTVSAVSGALVAGETQQLAITAVDGRGASVAAPSPVWTSSAPAVASVSAAGMVTAVGPGTATITALAGGRSASRDVVVLPGGLVATGGGTVTSGDGVVTLAVPAGAVAAQTRVTITHAADPVRSEHTVPGTVHALGPEGTQLAVPVSLELRYDPATLPAGAPRAALRVARLVGGEWRVVADGVVVDSARGTVRAAVRAFSTYAVVRDPCVVTPWTGTVAGQISPHDCLFTVAGRRSDYYTIQVPAGQAVTVTSTGALAGLLGLKEATSDPAAGTVWVSGAMGTPLRLVSDGSPLQLFVSGQDSTQHGAYTVTTTTGAPAHSCATSTYLVPGAALAMSLSAANSCTPTVQYPAIPQAAGMPLLTHLYGVKLVAGRRYTIRLGGLTPAFQAGLTVFAGGAVVAQQVPTGQLATARTITLTPTTTGSFVLEVSSGYFTDGSHTRWITPEGSYTLSVTAH